MRRQIARAIAAGTACEMEGITDAVSEIPLLVEIAEITRKHHAAVNTLQKAESAWRNFSARNSHDDPAHEEHRIRTLDARKLVEELGLELQITLHNHDLATGKVSPAISEAETEGAGRGLRS